MKGMDLMQELVLTIAHTERFMTHAQCERVREAVGAIRDALGMEELCD